MINAGSCGHVYGETGERASERPLPKGGAAKPTEQRNLSKEESSCRKRELPLNGNRTGHSPAPAHTAQQRYCRRQTQRPRRRRESGGKRVRPAGIRSAGASDESPSSSARTGCGVSWLPSQWVPTQRASQTSGSSPPAAQTRQTWEPKRMACAVLAALCTAARKPPPEQSRAERGQSVGRRH